MLQHRPDRHRTQQGAAGHLGCHLSNHNLVVTHTHPAPAVVLVFCLSLLYVRRGGRRVNSLIVTHPRWCPVRPRTARSSLIRALTCCIAGLIGTAPSKELLDIWNMDNHKLHALVLTSTLVFCMHAVPQVSSALSPARSCCTSGACILTNCMHCINVGVLYACCVAGLIGTAPSKELLDIWNSREGALVKDGPEGTTLGGVLHTRPLGGWMCLLFSKTVHSVRCIWQLCCNIQAQLLLFA
jgi:hypothetical protein